MPYLAFATPVAPPCASRSRRVSCPRRRKHVLRACLARPADAARARLLDLVGRRYTTRNAEADGALEQLLACADDVQLSQNTDGWERAVDGRWGLRYSTEPPLASLVEDGLPLLGAGKQSYQLFSGGGASVENVIEFERAVLAVGAAYAPRADVRAFDFRFRSTRLQFGKNARMYMGQDDSSGFGLDLTLPLAVGSGVVELVWLDHALRVDKSALAGEEVLNVYVYEGPVVKCTVKKDED